MMTTQRKLGWAMVALTAVLMWFLKWLHYGVTHYNIFLFILLGWTMALIIFFKVTTPSGGTDSSGKKASSGQGDAA